MPSFRWSAINPAGDVVRGVMEAPDRAIVVERLQRQGQVVLRADPAEGRRGWTDLLQIELGRGRGLDKTTLGEITRELAIMLAAGQDLDRALRFVVESTRNARARAILGNIRDKVRSGSSLAARDARSTSHAPRARTQPQRQFAVGDDLSGAADRRGGGLDCAVAGLRAAAIRADI
jgi:general secretion pathway protein F